jgi:sulfur-carrier protein
MHITVKLFARAKDLAGTGSLVLAVPELSTVGQARAALAARYPELHQLMPILLLAVDGNYATDATPLTESSELACFPPVSGG